MPARYSFVDYLKLAFRRKVPLPGLGPMPLNQMAVGVFAVLGIANPGFWFLGAALEFGYLFSVASSPRFQKLVQGEDLLAEQQAWDEKIEQAVAQLEPEGRERYRRLLAQCRRILGISETLADDSLGNFRDLRARNLNQLLGIFLRLLTSRQVIADNVEHLDRKQLKSEIAQLEARLARDGGGDEALARSLQGTLGIQRKRLENLDRATSSLQVIAAELERIEQQVELMREEAAVGGKPELLSDRLDAVTTHMSETSRWMDEQAQLFGNLGVEDGGVLVSLPALPELPEAQSQ